jgi:hypothetical protein
LKSKINYSSMNAKVENATAVGSSTQTITVARRDRGQFRFVLIVWLAMLTAALSFVAIYGSNVPSWDDWDMVPTVTGHQPVTLEWLWSQHNEHRAPVPRLLYLGLMRFVRPDFRTGMYFNVIVAAGLALALILSIRRMRGYASYLDAFFPLVLLNWGQATDLLWCCELQFYLSMLLVGIVLVAITRTISVPSLPLVLSAGICTTLLPLCGANGVVLAPALALWLIYAAARGTLQRNAMGRGTATVAIGCAVSAIALCALYFVGYEKVPYHPWTHESQSIIQTATQFLTIAFGPAIVGLSADGLPMPLWKWVAGAVVTIFALTAWMLMVIWHKKPADRVRSAGLLLLLAAMTSLALAVGMGREGFEVRYVALSVPALCAIYMAWSTYGYPRFEWLVRTLLVGAALLVLWPNTLWGLDYAFNLKSRLAAFEADLQSGMPRYQLIQRHARNLHPHHILVMDYLPMLREREIGSFRYLRDDPQLHEIPLPLLEGEALDDFSKGNADGWFTFGLPDDIFAAGIRVRYTYSNTRGTDPYVVVQWKSSQETAFAQDSWTKYSPTGDRANWQRGTWLRLADDVTTLHIWIYRPLHTVRVWLPPGRRVRAKIHEVALLVPAEADARR